MPELVVKVEKIGDLVVLLMNPSVAGRSRSRYCSVYLGSSVVSGVMEGKA